MQRKPKGFGNQHWFVKVGGKLWTDAATRGTKGVGPRIRNIRFLRKRFKEEVYRILVLINNQPVESLEHTAVDKDQADEAKDYENSLILLQIKTELMPLLFKGGTARDKLLDHHG